MRAHHSLPPHVQMALLLPGECSLNVAPSAWSSARQDKHITSVTESTGAHFTYNAERALSTDRRQWPLVNISEPGPNLSHTHDLPGLAKRLG